VNSEVVDVRTSFQFIVDIGVTLFGVSSLFYGLIIGMACGADRVGKKTRTIFRNFSTGYTPILIVLGLGHAVLAFYTSLQ
jgi:hypothetical protein